MEQDLDIKFIENDNECHNHVKGNFCNCQGDDNCGVETVNETIPVIYDDDLCPNDFDDWD